MYFDYGENKIQIFNFLTFPIGHRLYRVYEVTVGPISIFFKGHINLFKWDQVEHVLTMINLKLKR